MTVTALVGIIFLVLGPTAVFYASKAPGTLLPRVVIAAVGFILIAVALYLIGFVR